MDQAAHFLEESDVLAQAIATSCNGRWDTSTQFKNWTINDVLVHLYFWNQMADLSLQDPDAFNARIAESLQSLQANGLRGMENAAIPERGQDLFDRWQGFYRDMATRWQTVDPKQRLAWVGPTMSARSSITARQMETWAHGHEVFDLLGLTRSESDRIKNIVVLGVNTFGFSFQIRGKGQPEAMPALKLTAPSGAVWEFGDPDAGLIEGSALGFAQTVTQTRNVQDTDLQIAGDLAQDWMDNAQCFAGPPIDPPPAGTRHLQQG